MKYHFTNEEINLIKELSEHKTYSYIRKHYFSYIKNERIFRYICFKRLKIKKKCRLRINKETIKNCLNCNKIIRGRGKRYINAKMCSRECFFQNRKIKDPLERFFREKLTRLKSNAKKRKIKIRLNWQDLYDVFLKQNGKCYYLGIKMKTDFIKDPRMYLNPYQVSVDRIDSNKNYTKNNIVLCSWVMNSFKGELNIKQVTNLFKIIFKNKGKIYGKN